MKRLRKDIALSWVLLSLFLVQAFAPVAIASARFNNTLAGPEALEGLKALDGMVICTTTGLKRLTPEGDLVPVGEHEKGVVLEHCQACFTSSFTGDVDVPSANIITVNRVMKREKPLVVVMFKTSFWIAATIGARAPPA